MPAVAAPASLLRLLSAPGPSGQEDLAAAVWRDEAKGFGEVHTDVLGSSGLFPSPRADTAIALVAILVWIIGLAIGLSGAPLHDRR